VKIRVVEYWSIHHYFFFSRSQADPSVVNWLLIYQKSL
jgi:hypothetical protein